VNFFLLLKPYIISTKVDLDSCKLKDRDYQSNCYLSAEKKNIFQMAQRKRIQSKPVLNYRSRKTFLNAARRSTKSPCHKIPGFQCDHIVELQLVNEAHNRMSSRINVHGYKGKLIDYFQIPHNYQLLPTQVNQAKGQATRRHTARLPKQQGDTNFVNMARRAWDGWLRPGMLRRGYQPFIKSMDGILRAA